MKKFRRIIGVLLMAFNGIGFVSIAGSLAGFIGNKSFASWVLLLLFFGALFYLGFLLYTAESRKNRKKPKAGELQNPARDDARPNPAAQAETPAAAQRAVPDSAESIEVLSAYTVIAAYLALPFHDGDNFFLFKNQADAERFIRLSGRNDLSVRCLDGSNMKRELVEYLCCGYTGAIIKNNLTTVRICREDRRQSAEELICAYGLNELSSVGSVAPNAERKIHHYLNQLSYTFRKYGYDMSAVPDFWKKHLKQFKDEVIRALLCSDLCLPTQQGDGKKLTFSILSVSMPSGEKWAALFTDMFAISRYMRKAPNSIVFPNLLSDVAKSIREGEITGVAGIMINPGREEFKMTVDEIAEQEEWLNANPDSRSAYFEKETLPFAAAPESKAAAEPAAPEQPQEEPAENPAPASPEEPYQKIDLSENNKTASVTPSRSFFMGLLPDEKPCSDKKDADADRNRPDTGRYTKLDTIGFPSRWSEYYYDPKYRRIVIDLYTGNEKTGERWYHGRKTILPLDLIDQFNQYPEDRSPEKSARIQRIWKVIGREGFDE